MDTEFNSVMSKYFIDLRNVLGDSWTDIIYYRLVDDVRDIMNAHLEELGCSPVKAMSCIPHVDNLRDDPLYVGEEESLAVCAKFFDFPTVGTKEQLAQGILSSVIHDYLDEIASTDVPAEVTEACSPVILKHVFKQLNGIPAMRGAGSIEYLNEGDDGAIIGSPEALLICADILGDSIYRHRANMPKGELH